MYHPIPFTDLKNPGVLIAFPLLSVIILPFILFPSLLILPASRISKATELAFLVDVVLRLILYATRKSLAEIAVAPDFYIIELKSEGP